MKAGPGRHPRGKRKAVGIKIPVELFEAIERDRELAGATRLDWVWSVLAKHYDMPHLDPLRSEQDDQLDFEAVTTGAPKAKPTRAA